jgi:hypothetical protein
MLLELGVEILLELGHVLPEVGKNTLQIILEFSSKAKFEFFTVHYDSPPNYRKYTKKVGTAGGLLSRSTTARDLSDNSQKSPPRKLWLFFRKKVKKLLILDE